MHEKVFWESLDCLPSHFSKKEAGAECSSDKNIEYQIGKLDTAANFKYKKIKSHKCLKKIIAKKRKSLQRKESSFDKNIEYQIGKLDTAAKLNQVAI